MGAIAKRVQWIALSLVTITAMSVDAIAADWSAQIKQCTQVASDSARLKCYDNLFAETQPVTLPAVQPIKELSPSDKFGLTDTEVKNKIQSSDGSNNPPLQEISATIQELVRLPNGRLRFTLSNHQAWIQVMPVTDDWIAVGQTVHIKAGALGSFTLKNEHGLVYKVHRQD